MLPLYYSSLGYQIGGVVNELNKMICSFPKPTLLSYSLTVIKNKKKQQQQHLEIYIFLCCKLKKVSILFSKEEVDLEVDLCRMHNDDTATLALTSS